MKLNFLEITNFRTIKEAKIRFEDKVVGIIGPNGAGKSSIIEAISWALYGNQASRTSKDEIKSTFAAEKDICHVNLAFQLNDEKFRISRKISGKSDRIDVELYRGDSTESVGVADTQKYIAELLGLDWKSFLTSFLARQQELNALSDNSPAKRKDHLAGMLGIERLDKAVSKIKDEGKYLDKSISFLESQVSGSEYLEDEIKELDLTINELSVESSHNQAKFETKKKELNDLLEDYKKLQALKDKFTEIISKITAEKATEENLIENLDRVNEEEKSLKKDKEAVSSLQTKLEGYEQLVDSINELSKSKENFLLYKEQEKMLASLIQENEATKKELNQTDKILEKQKSILSTIPSDISDKLSLAQKNLENHRSNYTRIKAEISSTNKEEEKLKLQLESISSFGPESVCDRCNRKLGGDLVSIKEHFQKELIPISKSRKRLEIELLEFEVKGKKEKENSVKLESELQLGNETKLRVESLDKDKKRISDTFISIEKNIKELSVEMKKSGSEEFDQDKYELLIKKKAGLDIIKEELSKLSGKLIRLDEVVKLQTEFKENISVSQKEHNKLTANIKELDFDEEQYKQASISIKNEQENLQELSITFQESKSKLELSKKDKEAKVDKLKNFEKISKELNKNRESKFYTTKLASLFTEFRGEIIASIRPTLADISSRLISEMTGGRYNFIELDEKYNLRVMDSGEYFEIDRYSGGEKDLSNLCLRLAISQALTESAGMNGSFIMLDEVFGSQDSSRRELIISALGNLKHIFPQILLITHLDDIRDKVDQLIEVRPTKMGWSEITISG